jgi:hypothetical protein
VNNFKREDNAKFKGMSEKFNVHGIIRYEVRVKDRRDPVEL